MAMPPWNEVRDVLIQLVGPALAASLVVMFVLRWLGGENFSPVAAALAVAAGFVVGNELRTSPPVSYDLEAGRPLAVEDLRTVLGWSLEGKPAPKEGETAPEWPDNPPKPAYWLVWVAALAVLVELLMSLPEIPISAAWAARTLVAVVAARLLTPVALRVEMPAASWLLAGAITVQWLILANLAKNWFDGTVPAAAALCFAAASVFLLHVSFASAVDLSMLMFAALLGPALIAWIWPSDTTPAIAAVAVLLPSLLLLAQQGADTKVPFRAFLMAGLAPGALAPMLLPVMARQDRWLRWFPAIVLALIPAVIAVALAEQAEPLDFSATTKDGETW